MPEPPGVGRMDLPVGIEIGDIITWVIGGIIAVWLFFKQFVWPAYQENKKDIREFSQQNETAAFQQVLETDHILVADVITTKNRQIAEIRLAVLSSAEEVMTRITELDKRVQFLQASSQRQDAVFTILNMNIVGLIDEVGKVKEKHREDNLQDIQPITGTLSELSD